MNGRHATMGGLDGFMRDYETATTENLLNWRERVWLFGEASDPRYVLTEIRPFDGQIHISSIASTSRGKRHASAVLKQICALADHHGVVLDLAPEPFGEDGLDRDELEAWYRRHGFESEDEENDESTMQRPPRQIETGVA